MRGWQLFAYMYTAYRGTSTLPEDARHELAIHLDLVSGSAESSDGNKSNKSRLETATLAGSLQGEAPWESSILTLLMDKTREDAKAYLVHADDRSTRYSSAAAFNHPSRLV